MRSRLLAVVVAALALTLTPALAVAEAAPSILAATDAPLTLTAASTGTTLYGGVGAGLVMAAPYQVGGGSGQVTWTYNGLPSGLAISPKSGLIGGTPTIPGSFPMAITVTDADGQTQTGDATFLINPIGLATRSGLLPYIVAVTGKQVSAAPVIATGDDEGLEWSATGLPPGLSLDPGSGIVSGVPSVVGGYTTRFSATNVAGETASLSVLFEVVVGYTCNYHQTGTVGQALSIDCGVFWSPKPNEGGRWLGLPGHLSYSSKGLPKGLRLNAGTGMITGKPRKAGTSVTTVTVSARPDGILVTSPVKWNSVVRCVISA
jgi:hypothetical protein